MSYAPYVGRNKGAVFYVPYVGRNNDAPVGVLTGASSGARRVPHGALRVYKARYS